MKRKITLFAFAGKCGFFGASGPFAAFDSFESSDASAIDPTPIGQRLKKCRRVSVFNRSASLTALLPSDRFVEIQQHTCGCQGRQVLKDGDLVVRRRPRSADSKRGLQSARLNPLRQRLVHSTKPASLSSVSACNGVLLRRRRVQARNPSGASKTLRPGGGVRGT